MATQSGGKRFFSIVSIVINSLVLLIAVVAIIGVWASLGRVVEVTTGVLGGVEQMAQTGRNGLQRLDTGLTGLQTRLDDVTSAATQAAQTIEDQGLVKTLLPPEKMQRLEDVAEQISAGVTAIKEAADAARELVQAINRIPFVELPLPDPERVQAMQENAEAIRANVKEMAVGVQQVQAGMADKISTVSTTASKISGRLETTRENLQPVDSRLETLHTAAGQLKAQAQTYITLVAVGLTLFWAWIIYAMVSLIRGGLAGLRA
jgi:uncharacterized phage infection (PIP) family protein YhgE